MKTIRISLLGTSLLVAGLAAGCRDEGPPGAGLTNGPPLSAAGGEKTAGRDDIAAPAPPKQGEVLGQVGDTQTNAGIGGQSPEGASPPTTKDDTTSPR
jgi:hypothetical protein